MSLAMHCEPCGKSFSGPVCYSQHMESDKHKRKISSSNIFKNLNEKKVFNASEILSSSSVEHPRDSIECSACNLKFNLFEDFQTHSLSAEHAKRIIENAQMAAENSKNMVTLLIGSSTHSNDVGNNSNEILDEKDTILPEVEMFKSQASFSFCDTCKKSFSGPEPYKQHRESAGHLKKIAEIERKISLGINLAATELSCVPCNKTFSGIVPYDQHMSSDIHRKKMQSLQLLEKYEVDSNLKVNTTGLEPGPLNIENNPWYCKTCHIMCSGPAPFAQHNNGTTHLKNLIKTQREKGTNDVLCSSLQMNELNIPKEDILLFGLMDNNVKAQITELDESITLFSPDEEIYFDKQNSKTNSKLTEPVDEIDSEGQNNKTNLKTVDPGETVSGEQSNTTNLKSTEPKKIDFDEQNNKIHLESAEFKEIDFEEQNKTNLELADKNSDESELIQITLDACSLTMQGQENIPENRIEEKSDLFQICNYCNVKLHNKDEVVNHFDSLEHLKMEVKYLRGSVNSMSNQHG